MFFHSLSPLFCFFFKLKIKKKIHRTRRSKISTRRRSEPCSTSYLAILRSIVVWLQPTRIKGENRDAQINVRRYDRFAKRSSFPRLETKKVLADDSSARRSFSFRNASVVVILTLYYARELRHTCQRFFFFFFVSKRRDRNYESDRKCTRVYAAGNAVF